MCGCVDSQKKQPNYHAYLIVSSFPEGALLVVCFFLSLCTTVIIFVKTAIILLNVTSGRGDFRECFFPVVFCFVFVNNVISVNV